MKRNTFSLLLAFCCILFLHATTPQQPVDFVSVLVGTQSKFELSTGNTYPAIALPWGMNFWSPQTGKMGEGWMYTYTADKIRGFKQTHQPSPWMNDYGQFSIMPVGDNPVFDQEERASWFSHKAEIAKPYYYSVYLADHDVTTEITPTERAAMFRFTFPESNCSHIVIDAFDRGSFVKIIPEENKIIGYSTKNSGGVPSNFKNYFVVSFDKSFISNAIVENGEIKDNLYNTSNNHVGAIVGFQTKRGDVVHARVASSFISFEQAELNLKELGNYSFDQISKAGRDKWNEVLGRIKVEDENIDNIRTFYSSLYRSVLFPRTFYEYDSNGKIWHYSPYNGEVMPGYMFTDTGFWDTFRSLFPLLNLMYPSMNVKMQEGLVNAYKESGFLPEWASPGHRNIMIGNNSASVVADAYIKGLRGYDIESLWEALKHGANNVHPKVLSTGRHGFEYYNKLGYVPNDVGIRHSTARTLEYAYNDWTIYQLGKKLNKPQSEIEIYAKRAMNYVNVFNSPQKLMSGKSKEGVFDQNFIAEDWSDAFCEGNSWHWSFCVFHDPKGLINIMGGEKIFNQMLDSVFIVPGFKGMKSRKMIHEMREMQVMNLGQYAHGNQPIQHMIYMYNYSREPWRTQFWSREIMDRLYNAAPDGYCGDEDNGQTSAWYVMSSLGFYTVCPGTNQYVLGSPLFKRAKLHLENGKTVMIEAKNNSQNNRYVKIMKINNKVYNKNYLIHEDILKGITIKYEMSETPNYQRGINNDDLPYSFSNETIKFQK
ncbi:GH92 family glycosyl hydrolase [Paludibacter sp.]